MNLFQKLFSNKPVLASPPPVTGQTNMQSFEERETMLWKYLNETVAYYNSISCHCAFPRFRQMVSIDCIDYRKAFAVSETECLIGISSKYFFSQKIDNPSEASAELRTCKNCGSTYIFGWQDFSISVNRSVLKPIKLTLEDKGASPILPIPLFLGPSGHGIPDRNQMEPVSFEKFQKYMRELRS